MKPRKKRMAKFTPPTLDEVTARAREIELPAREAQKFILFYESKGWKVGSTPMKQWRSALAGWKLRWEERTPVNGRTRPFQPPPRLDCGPEPELGL